MSLFESLEALAGSGLIALAPAAGIEAPPGAALRGGAFAAFVRGREEAGQIGEILDRLAYEIWLAQDARGIPMHVAEAHARQLGAVLATCSPDPQTLSAALEARRGPEASVAHVRLASAVIALASRSGALEQAGLMAEVASFLLELIFAEALARPKLIESLAPAMAAFFRRAAAPARATPRSDSRTGLETAPAGALVPSSHTANAAALPKTDGLSERALERLAGVAARQSASPGPESRTLQDLAQWLHESCARLRAPSNDEPEVRRLKEAAAEALARGDFEEAMTLLLQIRSKLREQRRRTEQRLEEELENLRAELRKEAEATAGLAELAMARLDYARAAELFQEAVESLRESDHERRLHLALRRADALWHAGDEAGDARTLREAASAYSAAADAAAAAGYRPLMAAASQGLGDALLALADHQPSAELLEGAVAAFRAALKGLPREANPRRWALANFSLGNALARLCEIHQTTGERLEQASSAYQNALGVLTREADALRWAVINLNHATVLIRLGQIRDTRANWHAAAAAMVPALEVFEAQGAHRYAEQARRSLALLHRHWKLLEVPKAAE
jgi:tetratricopeptide (TPR) repeat protein